MSEKLKPCPFCGTTEHLFVENREERNPDYKSDHVVCGMCGVIHVKDDDLGWNNRPTEKAAREEVSSTLFRLMEKVLDSEKCWEWKGSLNNYGYGAFWYKNEYEYAPRVSYELFVGEIPEGKLVLHNCNNPLCVNPHHLFIGTHQDNMADMVAKGRSRGNELNRFSKLKTEQVIEILRLYKNGFTNKTALAKRFDVTRTTIKKIVTGESWQSINRESI